MSTFGLVHGAWLGSWCWERLTPELEAMGHRVIAMDLPVDDSSATFDDYADVVCAAVAGVGDDLILVGHSMGGQTVPLVASRISLRRLVYLCGVPPIPRRAFTEQMAEESDMLNPDYPKGLGEKDSEGRRRWIDRESARVHLMSDCDESTASAVFARLRPQSMAPYKVPCSLSAYPVVNTSYVVCDQDGMVNPLWSRRIAHEWLGADLIEIPGSHSPFLSRPAELAAMLGRLSQ